MSEIGEITTKISHISKSLRGAGWWVWWYGQKTDRLKESIVRARTQPSERVLKSYKKNSEKLLRAAKHYTWLMEQVNHELLRLKKDFSKTK